MGKFCFLILGKIFGEKFSVFFCKEPNLIKELSNVHVKDIFAFKKTSFAITGKFLKFLTSDDCVFGWGSNENLEFFEDIDPYKKVYPNPVKIDKLSGIGLKEIYDGFGITGKEIILIYYRKR